MVPLIQKVGAHLALRMNSTGQEHAGHARETVLRAQSQLARALPVVRHSHYRVESVAVLLHKLS